MFIRNEGKTNSDNNKKYKINSNSNIKRLDPLNRHISKTASLNETESDIRSTK